MIGGIGPAATEFYYRGLVKSQTAESKRLELTIAHADLKIQLYNMANKQPQAQAEVFRKHVKQLEGAGATVAAVTSIAGHFCFSELEAISPLPLVSALTALTAEIDRLGLRRIGLLGSQVAMESGLYGSIKNAEIVLPLGDELSIVGKEYLSMAVAQEASSSQRALFFDVGARLCAEQNAEVVILAGTDLILAFAGEEPGFEVIDSAEVHIQALAALAQQDE